MRKDYTAPGLAVQKIESDDVIAATFTESGDNEVNWLDGWASAVNGQV